MFAFMFGMCLYVVEKIRHLESSIRHVYSSPNKKFDCLHVCPEKDRGNTSKDNKAVLQVYPFQEFHETTSK